MSDEKVVTCHYCPKSGYVNSMWLVAPGKYICPSCGNRLLDELQAKKDKADAARRLHNA